MLCQSRDLPLRLKLGSETALTCPSGIPREGLPGRELQQDHEGLAAAAKVRHKPYIKSSDKWRIHSLSCRMKVGWINFSRCAPSFSCRRLESGKRHFEAHLLIVPARIHGYISILCQPWYKGCKIPTILIRFPVVLKNS